LGMTNLRSVRTLNKHSSQQFQRNIVHLFNIFKRLINYMKLKSNICSKLLLPEWYFVDKKAWS
jgi:hypothetical protein